jgi:tetratricopeptide (TPR) repeat protein
MKCRLIQIGWRKGKLRLAPVFSTLVLALWSLAVSLVFGQVDSATVIHQHWFETRTAHLNIYSCGTPLEVNKLAARLEQFRDAYGLLAGAQAVMSPPIIVMAFPDHETMQPFLPLYQGKAANLSGFFKRSPEENLIVLEMDGSLEVIFHEYTHLLLRRNAHIWPIWLNEGMAEIYSTFEASGRGVRIGKPIAHHLRYLAKSQLMPLKELMSVTHDSPQYNETERQGLFYAESWLLTHFLVNGDNPVIKARFAQSYTKLLHLGQTPEEAFTNALGVSLTTVDHELKRYLDRGQFESIGIVTATDLSAARSVSSRIIGPGEACYRLGNELMRIDRLDAAEGYFAETRRLIPASPLSYEGFGLLARDREKPQDAVRYLKEAMNRGSINFLAWFAYAQARLHLAGDAQGRYTRLDKNVAADIRSALEKSIALMPNFGNAHELLGFLQLVQNEDLPLAEQHLQRAIALDPDNLSYLLSLAQVQIMAKDTDAARRTLQPLLAPYAEPSLHRKAEELLSELDRQTTRKASDR